MSEHFHDLNCCADLFADAIACPMARRLLFDHIYRSWLSVGLDLWCIIDSITVLGKASLAYSH